MNVSKSCVLAIALAAAAAACSSSSSSTPPEPSVISASESTDKGAARAAEVTITAIVDKVDVKNRTVTLRGSDGTTETIRVDQQVRNLDQVKKGDEVMVTYFRSVAFEVVKKSDAELGATAAEDVDRAALGEKPGGVAARVITIVADIAKLDRAKNQAVLRGPEGKTMTVDVKNPENFDKVKVGDRVEITLTEAIAIDVKKAAKK